MRPHQLFLLLLGTELWFSALAQNSNQPAQCCFAYFPRKIGKEFIMSYEETRPDCSKKGIIFHTRRSVVLCVNPDDKWVQNVMKYLDKRNL